MVQSLAWRFDPPTMSRDAAAGATLRALEYAKQGSTQTEDIFFTKSEVGHLLDVTKIYQPLRLALGVGALAGFSWLILVLHRYKKLSPHFFLVARNLQIMLASISVAGLALFPRFFVAFHLVLFPQGNWAFPGNSVLIQIFPESFWKLMLTAFVLGVGAFALLYHLVSREPDDK